MRLTLIFSFFIFLNFMLILLPKMMPNVISLEQTLFWVFWVNGLFILTLILPAKSSYIFEYMSKAKLATETIMEKFSGEKSPSSDDKALHDRIEKRRVGKESTAGKSGEPSAEPSAQPSVKPSAPPLVPDAGPKSLDGGSSSLNSEERMSTDELGKIIDGGAGSKSLDGGASSLNSEDRMSTDELGNIIDDVQSGGGKAMKGGKDNVKACLSPMLKAYIKERKADGKSRDDIINLIDQNKDNKVSDKEFLNVIPE